MFWITIACVDYLNQIKEGQKKLETLDQEIKNYKSEIGKYHRIIMNDTGTNENALINAAIIEEHKKVKKRFKSQKKKIL